MHVITFFWWYFCGFWWCFLSCFFLIPFPVMFSCCISVAMTRCHPHVRTVVHGVSEGLMAKLTLNMEICPTCGPSHSWFLVHNSNMMAVMLCCDLSFGLQIATKFCTCHDSIAVVTCAKFCSDYSLQCGSVRSLMFIKLAFWEKKWSV